MDTEVQQWLAIAALHLREQQESISLTVLAGENEDDTIASLRQAADRVIASDRELNAARQTKTIVLEPEMERLRAIEQIML